MSVYIPPLPLQSMTVRLRELRIGEALAIAAMPIHLKEASTSVFLRKALEDSPAALAPVPDPLLWTVEERMMAVAHYLSATADDGPDFALGEARFSDYLLPDDKPRVAFADAGEVAGDRWRVYPLTGAMAESIERLGESATAFQGDAWWVAGRLACQMCREGEAHPALQPSDSWGDAERDAWLSDRLQVFAAFPESDFMALLLAYQMARQALTHLFVVGSDASGLLALPKQGGAGIAPARFPVRPCLGYWAQSHAGKPPPVGA